MAKNSIRHLALSPLSGFRCKKEVVPEWGGCEVVVREPSSAEWSEFRRLSLELLGQQVAEGQTERAGLSEEEQGRAYRYLDAWVISRVVLEPSGQRVFSDDDVDMLCDRMGPVFTRLVNISMDLSGMFQAPAQEAHSEAKKD
ncbi:phage tail assembly chaperone [Alcanivoracaceae bacterium MT1]